MKCIVHTPDQPERTDELIIAVQVTGREALSVGIVQLAVYVVLAQAGSHGETVVYLPLVLHKQCPGVDAGLIVNHLNTRGCNRRRPGDRVNVARLIHVIVKVLQAGD